MRSSDTAGLIVDPFSSLKDLYTSDFDICKYNKKYMLLQRCHYYPMTNLEETPLICFNKK